MSRPWIIAVLALWVVVGLALLIELGLLRRIGTVLEQAEARMRSQPPGQQWGLSPGSLVPHFEARRGNGRPLDSADLMGSPTVYLFMSRECGPCEMLAADLERKRKTLRSAPLVIITDDRSGSWPAVRDPAVTIVVQDDDRVSKLFETSATPHAFAVDRDGRVVESLIPSSRNDIERLASRASEGVIGEVVASS
jgi:thiol-disulfide isomerase/thioredoxin